MVQTLSSPATELSGHQNSEPAEMVLVPKDLLLEVLATAIRDSDTAADESNCHPHHWDATKADQEKIERLRQICTGAKVTAP